MNSQSTGPRLQNKACRKCGSKNWQSVEVAYLQSVRTTDRGNQSVSSFGASIAPPQPRSTVGGPLWTAFGLFCGGLIFIPYFADRNIASPSAAAAMLSPAVYVPALIIAVVAFFLHLGSALSYNAGHWQKDYRKWQSRFVCRTCGYTSPSSTGAGSTR